MGFSFRFGCQVTSLGRPHFRKYLVNKVGVRDDLVFGPRSGSGEGVATSTGVAWDDDAADKVGRRLSCTGYKGVV